MRHWRFNACIMASAPLRQLGACSALPRSPQLSCATPQRFAWSAAWCTAWQCLPSRIIGNQRIGRHSPPRSWIEVAGGGGRKKGKRPLVLDQHEASQNETLNMTLPSNLIVVEGGSGLLTCRWVLPRDHRPWIVYKLQLLFPFNYILEIPISIRNCRFLQDEMIFRLQIYEI
jgi:hypothetical protein